MGKTFYLASKTTKTFLWCGQCPNNKPDRFYLYTGYPIKINRTQDQIAAFLMANQGREIALVENRDDIEKEPLNWTNDWFEDGWLEVEAKCDEEGNVYFVPSKDDVEDVKEDKEWMEKHAERLNLEIYIYGWFYSKK